MEIQAIPVTALVFVLDSGNKKYSNNLKTGTVPFPKRNRPHFKKNSQTPLLFFNIYNKIIPKRKGEQMNKTKKIKKIITTLIFLILFIILGNTKSNAGSLYLDNLDFDAKINQDGSMNVTETWDI